jgi:hypothetical protein
LARALLAIGAVVLVAAGCGGSKEARTTIVTVTNVSTVTQKAPPTHTLVAGAPRNYGSFQMPSKNVGCRFDSGFLRCDILSGLVPEPAGPCELDWTGYVIGATGKAEAECAGDTAYDSSAPILAYGETWARAGILCESRTAGLRCRNQEGRGFELARGASNIF